MSHERLPFADKQDNVLRSVNGFLETQEWRTDYGKLWLGTGTIKEVRELRPRLPDSPTFWEWRYVRYVLGRSVEETEHHAGINWPAGQIPELKVAALYTIYDIDLKSGTLSVVQNMGIYSLRAEAYLSKHYGVGDLPNVEQWNSLDHFISEWDKQTHTPPS